MKEAFAFLNSIVRTTESQANYPEAPDMSLEEWVSIINAYRAFDSETSFGRLLPPRLTYYHNVPSTIENNFETIIKQLNPATVHPGMLFALTAIALDAQPEERKMERTKALAEWMNIHQDVKSYPVVTLFLSQLHPEFFMTANPMIVSVHGTGVGGDVEHKNSVSSLHIKQNNMRVNPSNIFTSKMHISINENYFFENKMHLEDAAIRAFHGKKPLASHFWLMGLADKEVFKNIISPAAALMSPFYSLSEIDELAKQFFQLARDVDGLDVHVGIQDLYPNLEDEMVFLDYYHPGALQVQPMSKTTIEYMAKALVSNKNKFFVSSDFFEKLRTNTTQLDVLDLIPEYSLFHSSNKGSSFLSEYEKHGVSTESVKRFMIELLNYQKDFEDDVLTNGEPPGSCATISLVRNETKVNYEQNI